MIMYWVVYFLFINSGILLSFILVYVFDVGFFNFVIFFYYIDRILVVFKVNC